MNGTYDAGETIQLYLDFSQRTSVHGGRAQVALTIGANTRQATWTPDLTGSNRYHVYQYTVTAADEDTNGISIGADALNLPTGVTLRDGVAYEDVALSLGSHAITDASAHTVRDYAPTLPAIPAQHFTAGTAVNFVLPKGAGGNGALIYGISPTTLPGGLTMVVSANATTTLTGTPTAAAVGGPTTYTWMVMDADGDVGMTEFDISIAAANAPQVTDVRIFSTPRAGSGNTYDADATRPIIVDVEFDQEIMVNSPQSGSGVRSQLALEIGSRTVQATLLPTLYGVVCTVNGERRPGSSATDSGCALDYTVLRFQYAVQGTDEDTDGISIPAGALARNDGTIRDRATNAIDAALGLGSHAISNAAGHKVDGGSNVAPVVTGLELIGQATPPANGYQTGAVISINLTFDENIIVTGTPSIALQVGDNTRTAAFDSVVRPEGAGATDPYKTLKFTYTVQTSDYDADGISIGDTLDSDGNVATHAVTLGASVTIRDAGGRDATLALGTQAIANDADFKVFSPPKITGVSIISTPNQNGTYSWSSHITIAIDYDQDVTYTPASATSTGRRLALGVASGDLVVYPSSMHSRSDRLAFSHDVMHTDLDLDGVSLAADALKLNGGTLRDAQGEDAQIDLTAFTFTNQADAKLDGTKSLLWPVFATTTLTVSNPVVNTAATINLPSPGGDLPLTWSIAPALPAGLRINAATGVISGAATSETPVTEYTVTVKDSAGVPAGGLGSHDRVNGDTASVNFQMRVTGVKPVVTGISITSSPQQGSTYAASEEVVVGVTFATDITENLLVRGTPGWPSRLAATPARPPTTGRRKAAAPSISATPSSQRTWTPTASAWRPAPLPSAAGPPFAASGAMTP